MMLSTPKELTAIGIGALENLGLGRMAPFVKLGLDAMQGNRQDFNDEIQDLIADFESDFPAGAAKMPPLGNFQSVAEGTTPLSSKRLGELLKEFNGLIGKSGGPNGEKGFDSLRRVFGTVNLLYQTFNDFNQYSDRAAGSTYSNLRM